MTHSVQIEHKTIEAIASKLEQDGYTVVIEPSSQELPFDLGHYRPDLVATRGHQGGIILEVKSSSSRLSVDRFQELADTIATHDGWRFLLVTSDDISGNGLISSHDPLPDWESFQSKIQEIEKLIQARMSEPALLYSWSTLEAILRKRAIAQNLPVERFPFLQLLNHMYSSGEISMDEFDHIKARLEKRDRIAHGLMAVVKAEELEELLAIIRSLMEQWGG